MNIGFDFDSVITDSTGLKAEYAMSLYGIEVPRELFKWYTTVPQGILTQEQYERVQHAVHYTKDISARMEPVGAAVASLQQILRDGHRVRIVTGRDGRAVQNAKEWLQDRSLGIPVYGVGAGVDKTPTCKGLELFVDDDLDKLEPMIGVVPNLYLFSWKFNEHIVTPPSIGRVSSWEEIYHHVRELARGSSGVGQ